MQCKMREPNKSILFILFIFFFFSRAPSFSITQKDRKVNKKKRQKKKTMLLVGDSLYRHLIRICWKYLTWLGFLFLSRLTFILFDFIWYVFIIEVHNWKYGFSLILSSIYWSENFTNFILAGLYHYVREIVIRFRDTASYIPYSTKKISKRNMAVTENCLCWLNTISFGWNAKCICMNGQNEFC